MKFQKATALAIGASLLTLVSCGQKDSASKSLDASQENVHISQDDGEFRAVLRTLNGHVRGNNTTGEAHLKVKNGQLVIEIEVEGAPANIVHIQHIHSADRCPTMAADTNKDGFVDVIEGIPAYGPILLNLDGDLTDHMAGGDGFPTADTLGNFFYSQSAPLNAVLADLRAPFRDENDALTRLQGNFNLAGRHIVVHGVASDINLPDSVQSIGDIPNNVTLPIACGEIRRVPVTNGGKI